VRALAAIDGWEADHAAAGVVHGGTVVATHGALAHEFRWASVTKLLTALAVLVAAEEGSLGLDDPCGPPGSTVRHLLAHASGLPFEGEEPLAGPGERRIYSNTGFAVLGRHLAERVGMPFEEYVEAAVLGPAGLHATRLATDEPRGVAAAGAWGPVADLIVLGQELLSPRVVAAETLAEATRVAFPGLAGVLPGFGRQDPCDWGLGFELRGAKSPHWTGARNSAQTFGHFGGSGTFVWVDPARSLALACLTDREFGDWAVAAWPALADAVIGDVDALAGQSSGATSRS
jgi:CubicO group peptidase (beta-lactamase class C family)